MSFDINKFHKNIRKLFLKENIKKLIIISGLISIGLIFISNLLGTKPSKGKKMENKDVQLSSGEYVRGLEENIKSIVSSIDGAGESKVLITLESSVQNIYAIEQKKNNEATEDRENDAVSKKKQTNDLETRYIKIKDENGAERALSLTQIQPTIKGVVIVCSGGNNPIIKEKITNAVKTALNITSKRVYVTK